MTVQPKALTALPPEMLEEIFSYIITDFETFRIRDVCRSFRGIIDRIFERKYPFFSLLQKLQERSDLFKSKKMDELLKDQDFLEQPWIQKISISVKLAERELKAINVKVTEKDLKVPRLPKALPIEQLIYQVNWLESQKAHTYSEFLIAVRKNGRILIMVPGALRDKNTWIAAVQGGFSFCKVPKDLREEVRKILVV